VTASITPLHGDPLFPPLDEEHFYGSFATEDEAGEALDAALAASNLFDRVFTEVRGHYLIHRPHQRHRDFPQIDRVLIPSERLRSAGFTSAIGVEIKRSDEPVGPAIGQALDYTYAAFRCGSFSLQLDYIFLYPLLPQHGAVRALMNHNGIGALYDRRNSPLVFELERRVIELADDGALFVQATNAGTKKGSR
jgi:hypothetical protein